MAEHHYMPVQLSHTIVGYQTRQSTTSPAAILMTVDAAFYFADFDDHLIEIIARSYGGGVR
jgi:hypothetical protein